MEEGNSSISDLLQNLDLSVYSASLLNDENGEPIYSSIMSSDIAGSPQIFRSRLGSPLSSSNRSIESMLRQRDNVIESIRQQSRNQIEALQNKLLSTLKTIETLKSSFKQKINTLMEENQKEKEQLSAEIEKVKRVSKARRSELTFSRLPHLTEEEYQSFRGKKPTIPQYIAIQLYEHDADAKKQIAEANRIRDESLSNLEKINVELKEANSSLLYERELRISLENRLASMTGKTPIKSLPSPSPQQLDHIRKLEKEISDLRASCQTALDRGNNTASERDSALKKVRKLENELTRANQDIQTLRSQIDTVSAFSSKQEAMLQDYRMEISELKRIRDEFYNKTVFTSEQRRQDIGSLVQTEVQRISERSRSDVEFIRNLSEKTREREVQILTAAHEAALDEVKQLRLDLRKAEEARASVQAEYQTLQLAHEAELTRQASELRVKTYELESLKLKFEELQAANEDAGYDREALQQKFDTVKEELLRKESEARMSEQKIVQLTEKLQMYERLEGELDSAIENIQPGSGTPIAVPADASRRVKQSIMLSKRVMQLTQQNSTLESELSKTKEQLASTNAEAERLREQIRAAGKPQQVFVTMLQEKQEEIERLRKKVAVMSETNKGLEMQRESMKRDFKIASGLHEERRASAKVTTCPFGYDGGDDDDVPTLENDDPAPFIITKYK